MPGSLATRSTCGCSAGAAEKQHEVLASASCGECPRRSLPRPQANASEVDAGGKNRRMYRCCRHLTHSGSCSTRTLVVARRQFRGRTFQSRTYAATPPPSSPACARTKGAHHTPLRFGARLARYVQQPSPTTRRHAHETDPQARTRPYTEFAKAADLLEVCDEPRRSRRHLRLE
jgi:hypothetical protein